MTWRIYLYVAQHSCEGRELWQLGNRSEWSSETRDATELSLAVVVVRYVKLRDRYCEYFKHSVLSGRIEGQPG